MLHVTRCFVETSFSVLTALRAIETAIALFSFDNIVFPQPARHNLQLCYARPIAADVVEPSVADLGFQLSDFTFHRTSCA